MSKEEKLIVDIKEIKPIFNGDAIKTISEIHQNDKLLRVAGLSSLEK